MRTKKRSDYIYPPEKKKEWRDNYLSRMTPEQKAARKEKQKEYNKKRNQKRKEQIFQRRANQPPLPDRKICHRCNIEKDKEDFRIRTEKRCEPHFEYLNNTCKQCDAEVTRISYRKTKDKNREKNAAKARQYYRENKDAVREREKKRRQTQKYKDWVKAYYKKNRDRILENHRNVCRRAVSELRDWVIVGRYSQHKNSHLRPILKGNKELIEVMRLKTILKQTIKGKK